MKDRQISINKSEFISIISFSLIFFVKGMGFYDGQKIFTLFLGVLLLLTMAKLAGEIYFPEELILYGILGAVAIYSYTFSREKGVLLCLCMIFLMKNTHLNSICKAGALSLGLFSVIRGILSLTRVMEHKVFLHDKLGGEILRYSFGQPHPSLYIKNMYI